MAKRLGATYIEGDDLHPQANIEKMSAGIPLEDADRWPWLDQIAQTIAETAGVVVAGCSALKRSYRDRLRDGTSEPVLYVHLTGSRDLIAKRMETRPGHFMPPSLLESQFQALQQLGDDEIGFCIDIDTSIEEIVESAMGQLSQKPG